MPANPIANIYSSETFILASEATGQEYLISVALPRSYDHQPEATYPAIYVIDGNFHFESVAGLCRLMGLNSTIPEVAIISIGYPLDGFYGEQYNEFFIRRARDLTVTVDQEYEYFLRSNFPIDGKVIAMGGAEYFLKFVTEELIPTVEVQYRINSEDRTLLGHSTGGHFAIYALLQSKPAFNGFAIGSPSLGFGGEAIFDLENEFAAQADQLPARVYLGIGEQEEHSPLSPAGYLGTIVSISAFYRFAAILEDRGYAGLKIKKKVFEGHDHTDVMGPFVAAALKYLFTEAD